MKLRKENIQEALHPSVSYGCRLAVWVVFVWIFLSFAQPAFAQKPLTPLLQSNNAHAPEDVNTTKKVSGVPQTEQDIKNKIESLEELLGNARRRIQSEKVKIESATPEQLGVLNSEIQRKELLLIKMVFAYEQHIETYYTLLETHRASKNLTVAIDNWKGFDTSPPYSISLVDELLDAIGTKKLEIKKDEVKRSIAEDNLKEARSIFKASEQVLRQIKEKLEETAATTDRDRMNWLRDLYQLENEVASAQIIADETQRQVTNEVLAYRHKSLNFMERKLKVAAANAPFTKEELDKKNKTIEARIKTVKDELRQAIRNDMKRKGRLQDARQELSKARESLANGKEKAEKITDEIQRLQRVVDVRKAWSDTTSLIAEGLKLSLSGLNAEQLFLEKRYKLVNTGSDAELREAEQEISNMLEKLRNSQFHFDSDLKSTISTLLNERRRLATLSSEDKETEFVSLTIDAYEKRTVSLERRLAHVNEFIRVLDRFQDEIKGRRQRLSFGERMDVVFSIALNYAEDLWNFELFAAEDTILVDGQRITERRPITISKVVRALLILGIGLWLSYVLARFVHSISVKRFKAEPSVASLVKKTFYTVSVFIVVIFAMITVKIPLTVFAFMGGSLAIGIGFGAKNLINNFISGIILLFERPIKIGDIVEVEDMRGEVVKIGGRCSQIRRFDGIDILVPNSSLLEKDVVNWTLSDKHLRMKVRVGVAYGSSTRDVAEIIAHTVDEHGKILKEPKPNVIFEDFGDSALIFTVYFWIEVTSDVDYRIVKSDIRHMLDKRFRDAGITIAYPQRDVHIDSSRPIEIQFSEGQSQRIMERDSESDKG
jgi:small-conductance mechanosensitive channel